MKKEYMIGIILAIIGLIIALLLFVFKSTASKQSSNYISVKDTGAAPDTFVLAYFDQIQRIILEHRGHLPTLQPLLEGLLIGNQINQVQFDSAIAQAQALGFL